MSAQPEALRLADELDDLNAGRNYDTPLTEAAAELRRLHAENEALQAQKAVDFVEHQRELSRALDQRDELLAAQRMKALRAARKEALK